MFKLCCNQFDGAKIQIKFNIMSIKAVLFKKTYSNGMRPIMLRLTHERKSTYFKIGDNRFVIEEKQWNPEFGLLKCDKRLTPDHHVLNEYIKAKCSMAQSIIDTYEMKGINWNFSMFENDFLRTSFTQSIQSFIETRISELTQNAKHNTASTYSELLILLEQYRSNFKRLLFYDLDYTFVEGFYHFLKERNNNDNTISIRLRALRAILNESINRGVGEKSTYPFSNVYGAKRVFKISHLNKTNNKRAIPKDLIVKLYKAKLKGTYLNWARDIFMFSFFANGINFKDMAYLTQSNIKGNILEYTRSKTNVVIQVPYIKELEDLVSTDAHYLLPILTRDLKGAEMDKHIKERRKLCNKKLKELAKLLEFPPTLLNITTYYSRHSYATIMLHNGASVELISQSLGHKDIKTTQIYLSEFDIDTMTAFNQVLLD